MTVDQQFLFYSTLTYSEEMLKLMLSKRLVGYNEEIVDMKFLGEDEQFLAVATNLEQVNHSKFLYSLRPFLCGLRVGISVCW